MATLSAGFETGDLSEFDIAVTDSGDLSANASAAYTGSYGMQAVLNNNTSIYGQWTFANKSQIRVGFWFDPNGFSTVDDMIIAGGGATIGGDDWRIRLKWTGAALQVYASATNDGGTFDATSDVTISDTWHWIEAHFSRSTGVGENDGFVKLWVDTVDETPDAELTSRDDDEKDFDYVNVGAGSVAEDLDETIYFDDIRVNDTGDAIGPVEPAATTAAMYAIFKETPAVTAAMYSMLTKPTHFILYGGRVIVAGDGKVILR